MDNTLLDRSAEFFISYLASFINIISKYNSNLTETDIKYSKAEQVCQEVILAFGKSFSDHCQLADIGSAIATVKCTCREVNIKISQSECMECLSES